MRMSRSPLAWTVAAAVMLWPGPLVAQTPAPPRLDTSGTVGWFANDRDTREDQLFDGDTQHRWVFGGDAGFYWTEHLKSEVGLSATTTGSSYALAPIAAPTARAYPFVSANRRTREVRVVAQQIYQFGHNAWVHPYVGWAPWCSGRLRASSSISLHSRCRGFRGSHPNAARPRHA